MQDSLKEEQTSEDKMVEHVKELANQLYQHVGCHGNLGTFFSLVIFYTCTELV